MIEMKVRIDSFVIAIIVVIAVAYMQPAWGAKSSPIPFDLIGSIGISLIFFFYGLRLSPEKIRYGLRNWKLHVMVQVSTFVIFPLTVLLFRPIALTEQGYNLWLSFLFLAALPSTVSSAVVMVSIAKGNVPAAIFNASISGLIGIVITPMWMGFFLQHSSIDYSLGSIYLKLATEILLPVVLGILLQRKLGKYALKWNRYLSTFDKSVVLLIIYKSFSESFGKQVFSSVNGLGLFLIFLATISLFFVIFFLTGYLSKFLRFNQEDIITTQFCGTKKSLIHGTVFSKILFPDTISIGIILLPLMIFHALQIFIVSIIASKLGQRKME